MMQESASPMCTPLRGRTQTHAPRMAMVASHQTQPPPEPLQGTLQPEAMQELSRLLLLQAAEAAKGFAAEQHVEPAPSGAEGQPDADGERGRIAPTETLDLAITDEALLSTVSPSGANYIGATLLSPASHSILQVAHALHPSSGVRLRLRRNLHLHSGRSRSHISM
jgi:hypothetical protein